MLLPVCGAESDDNGENILKIHKFFRGKRIHYKPRSPFGLAIFCHQSLLTPYYFNENYTEHAIVPSY